MSSVEIKITAPAMAAAVSRAIAIEMSRKAGDDLVTAVSARVAADEVRVRRRDVKVRLKTAKISSAAARP